MTDLTHKSLLKLQKIMESPEPTPKPVAPAPRENPYPGTLGVERQAQTVRDHLARIETSAHLLLQDVENARLLLG